MASLASIQHYVFEPDVMPEPSSPLTRSIQVEVTLYLHLNFSRHHRSTNSSTFPDVGPFFSQQTLRFDLDVFRDPALAFQTLSHMLSSLLKTVETDLVKFNILAFFREPYAFSGALQDIIRCGVRMASRNMSCTGNLVLPLHATMSGTIVQHTEDGNEEDNLVGISENEEAEFEILDENDEELIIALEEFDNEGLEFESGSYGMVPAKQSSVKKMVKKVISVEGDEDCMICLAQIEAGSDASQMPCSHPFHGSCVERWLKQSHYCPVCRFKMPI